MEEKPNQGDNHKDGDKAKGGTSRKEPSKPAENAITNANDLKSFGNLNRLRNIDKKKVETDLLSKVSKSSPAVILFFRL